MNIYADVLYVKRQVREHWYSRRKRTETRPVGFLFRHAAGINAEMFDRTYHSKRSDREQYPYLFAQLPDLSDKHAWRSPEEMKDLMDSFFTHVYRPEYSTINFILDGDPNKAALVTNLLLEMGVKNFNVVSLSEYILSAARLLPDDCYGLSSPFDAYSPRKEGDKGYSDSQKISMFTSHPELRFDYAEQHGNFRMKPLVIERTWSTVEQIVSDCLSALLPNTTEPTDEGHPALKDGATLQVPPLSLDLSANVIAFMSHQQTAEQEMSRRLMSLNAEILPIKNPISADENDNPE